MATKDFKRKLSAIFSADVKGYSRLMAEDEAATVKTITAYREIMAILIKQHRGRMVDSPGDNVLAEFASVVDAVQCAVAVQKEFKARNAELPEDRRMEFRVGVNLGDVIEEEDRIYGDGVNIAARLEALAEPGGICISKTAFDQIETKLPLGYEYLGEQHVKNIPKPVGAYRVLMEPRVTVAEDIEKKKAVPVWRRKPILLGGVAFVVVVIAALIWNFYFRPAPIEPASMERMAYPLPDKPSIAVLPFANLSGDPDQDYFSDGITEEIITALSKVPKVFVIARNSTFTYKGKSVKVNKVAEELGVRYVLEGSVRKAGDRVRITAQLIDAPSGHHLWAERYERELKDIFAIQDEITMKITSAMQVKLTEGESASIYVKGTEDLKAYLNILEGRELLNALNRDDNALARKKFEEAIALDSKYAVAHALLGFTYVMDFAYGINREESMKKAFESTQKALSLDDSQVFVYTTMEIMFGFRRQHEKAIASGEKAIEIAPGSAYAQFSLGRALNFACRDKEALMHLEKAVRINPFPPAHYFMHIGSAHLNLGNHQEAVSALKKALAITPRNEFAIACLLVTYVEMGRMEEARAEFQEYLKTNPKPPTPEAYEKRSPWKDPKVTERFIQAFRKLRS
jgi:adenylate cyclase